MSDYKDIKRDIRKSGKLIYWYDEKGKLLFTDKSKSNSRKRIKKMDYNGALYRLSISFHTGKIFGQGGPMQVSCKQFFLQDKKLTKGPSKKSGAIYFEEDYLDMNGWSEDYLDIIVKKLSRNLNFGVGIYTFPI